MTSSPFGSLYFSNSILGSLPSAWARGANARVATSARAFQGFMARERSSELERLHAEEHVVLRHCVQPQQQAAGLGRRDIDLDDPADRLRIEGPADIVLRGRPRGRERRRLDRESLDLDGE